MTTIKIRVWGISSNVPSRTWVPFHRQRWNGTSMGMILGGLGGGACPSQGLTIPLLSWPFYWVHFPFAIDP